MINTQDEYLSELLRLRLGRSPTMLDLEGLHHDAVRAAGLLDLALDQFDEHEPGTPDHMVGCSLEHHATILFAMQSLRQAVQLAERGWHMVWEAERAAKVEETAA